MTPRLRVLAGTSPETMVPITNKVNTDKAHKFTSELYEGEIVVNIQGFADPEGRVRDSGYFARRDRQGITWSIQVRGRFLATYSADNILFGNTFDRPLKLPWGSGAALKFMNFVDPTLEHDLTSPTKPWALSPLIATMPHFMHTRIPLDNLPLPRSSQNRSGPLKPPPTFSVKPSGRTVTLPPFPPPHTIKDDTSQLHLTLVNDTTPGSTSSPAYALPSSIASARSLTNSQSGFTSSSSKVRSGHLGTDNVKNAVEVVKRNRNRTNGMSSALNLANAGQRRSYFSTSSHRQDVQFGPEDVITTDFCYGFLEFHPTLSLRLPGGITFDLMRYWDGQPVRFVCCERKDFNAFESGDPWGKIFWCVSIEMEDDEEAGGQ